MTRHIPGTDPLAPQPYSPAEVADLVARACRHRPSYAERPRGAIARAVSRVLAGETMKEALYAERLSLRTHGSLYGAVARARRQR